MEMTYTLPRVARPVGAGPFAVRESAEFYGSGSSVPVDFIGLSSGSSRSASLDQPQFLITVEMDPVPSIDLRQSLGASFVNWLAHTSFPAVSSSYLVRIASGAVAAAAACPRYTPPQQQIEEAVFLFSLNISQAAEVFGVSRPAVYAWREGASINLKHRARISQIHDFAELLRKTDPVPIGEALTWTDANTGHSLLSLLTAEPLDNDNIRRCIEALPQRIKEWWNPANEIIARNVADESPAMSEAWRKEMRRHTAGRNIRSGKTKPF